MALARFNRVVTNRLAAPFAAHLPGFALLHHQGRVTGDRYSTPLNAWRRGQVIVVALTYGAGVDWLRNATARPPSIMVIRGAPTRVGRPRVLTTEEGMAAMPAPVRLVLRALGVTGFVAFPVAPSVRK